MAKRITQKDILAHFHDTFDNGKVRTPSEYKMQAYKLKNLKKSVKEYLETAGIKTDKSVEKIIYEAITYAGMMGCKFNSIASIGYDILPKSIAYWTKLELAQKEQAKREAEAKAEEEAKDAIATKTKENNERMAETRKVPKWMQMDDDE